MKKSELKNLLRPVVEELIKEMLYEDRLLGNIISETVRGLTSGQTVVTEQNARSQPESLPMRERMLSNLSGRAGTAPANAGAEAYAGADFPDPEAPARKPRKKEDSISESKARLALKDRDPSDPGVNIDGIMNVIGGKGAWKKRLQEGAK